MSEIPYVCRQKIYGNCYCGRCSDCWLEETKDEECDLNRLHLHLTIYEVQMLRYGIAHASSLIGLPTRDELIRVFDDFILYHLEANIFEEEGG